MAIVKRLTREKAKYADYEDMKSKAAKLDELEKITEKATKLLRSLLGKVVASCRQGTPERLSEYKA